MGLFAGLNLPCYLEPRLLRRYETLIKEHMRVNPSNAPGIKALANHQQTWGAPQAAWRFFNNDNASFPLLSCPLLALARQAAATSSSRYLLVAHDWCRCNFASHNSKLDKAKLSHKHDIGYELQASLMIDGASGRPLAQLGLNQHTEQGVYLCREVEPQPKQPHLDELVARIRWQEQLGLEKPLVYVVDREADSVSHLRQLVHCRWLTRCKQDSTLLHEGQHKTVRKIAQALQPELIGPVSLRGRCGFLFVGEAQVALQRKTERNKVSEPPAARLVLSRVVDEHGNELASWYLLSNVTDVAASELAQWYCWRWNIESWLKLLKSDGFQIENWQQTNGAALFRRLLVSSMTCTLTFKLYQDEREDAQQLKQFLVCLSGRITKRAKQVTLPALLAGLYLFLQMQEVMSIYTADELKELTQIASRFFGQLV
ncbi:MULTISPECIES: transposase [Aeromonas]|uniref:transposase n=1 Tax=Aeromonas TaxID=642 RepID=UPI0015DD417D|nr:transposase [Aeromonas veronii]BBU05661.1 IS4 family transposase [Aeromonas veronii]